ncbi:hypothetical protein M9X92_010949 [Pyricularia oryzae]|nr:hypothetical protein M9X92_010949 [Pyricularia oryzae]
MSPMKSYIIPLSVVPHTGRHRLPIMPPISSSTYTDELRSPVSPAYDLPSMPPPPLTGTTSPLMADAGEAEFVDGRLLQTQQQGLHSSKASSERGKTRLPPNDFSSHILRSHNRLKTIQRRPQTRKPVKPTKLAPEADDHPKRIQDLERCIALIEVKLGMSTFASPSQLGRVYQSHIGRQTYDLAFPLSPYANSNPSLRLPAIREVAPDRANLHMRKAPNKHQSRRCIEGRSSKMLSLSDMCTPPDEFHAAKTPKETRIKKENSCKPAKICVKDTRSTRDHPIVVE